MGLKRKVPGAIPAFFATAFLLATCLPADAQRLRVAFVGDPQVDNETDLSYARRSVYRELRERKDLDLTIFLGDIVNDDVTLLEPSRASMDSLSCPWACVPGNHDRDFYGLKRGKPVSIDRTVQPGRSRDMVTYSRIFGPRDTAFVRGGVCFILMDDIRTVGPGGYEGGFREAQKDWLRKVLAGTPQEMQGVLCAHIPFSEFKALDSLETLLSVHPKLLLLCGHTHTMERHELRLPGGLAVEEVFVGAACGSWWRGRPDENGIPAATMNCGSPRSYYVADFSKGSYRLDYKVIGRPAAEKASTFLTDSTRLVLNIYGGAVGGKVQVKIPGIRGWITVPQRSEPAPEVYEVIAFNRTLDRQNRSRNPLYIPMRTMDSPHVWSVNFKGDGKRVAALRRAVGKRVKIRYRDDSMAFSARCEVKEP